MADRSVENAESLFSVVSRRSEPLTLQEHFRGSVLGREFDLTDVVFGGYVGCVVRVDQNRRGVGILQLAILGGGESPVTATADGPASSWVGITSDGMPFVDVETEAGQQALDNHLGTLG